MRKLSFVNKNTKNEPEVPDLLPAFTDKAFWVSRGREQINGKNIRIDFSKIE